MSDKKPSENNSKIPAENYGKIPSAERGGKTPPAEIFGNLVFELGKDGNSYTLLGTDDINIKRLVIPETYRGLPVTEVKTYDAKAVTYHRFMSCSQLQSVYLPKTLKKIDSTFSRCNNLETIKINTANKKFHVDGECIIDTRRKILVSGIKTSIIPADGSVTEIGNFAFFACEELGSIEIPKAITKIGEYAFEYCKNLKSIFIPENVAQIGECAFAHCRNLESIIVDSKNEFYHSYGCCLIETKSKTLIAGCKNSVLPKDGRISKIANGAFICCHDLGNIIIPQGVKEIGDYAFFMCKGLNSVVMPNGVKVIGAGAFWFSGLKSVEIPVSVQEIKLHAFVLCYNLQIKYHGTKEQWKKIKKNKDTFSMLFAVHCSDGDI